MTTEVDPKLLEFCTTERQREVLQTLLQTGSKRATAKLLNTEPQYVRRVVTIAERRAAQAGYSPKHRISRKSRSRRRRTRWMTSCPATY